MTRSLLARQLPVDEWIMLPTKPGVRETIQTKAIEGRYIRHVLFDIGGGLFTNLSPELHQIVLNACRSAYSIYLDKCKLDGRTPVRFKSGGHGYIEIWKKAMKRCYLYRDIPRKLKEYQKVA